MSFVQLMRAHQLVAHRRVSRWTRRVFADIASVLRHVFMGSHRLAWCASATRGSIGWKRVHHRDGGAS